MQKVSVIIPTFRRPDKLKRAIDSVLAQTYPHIELWVVDDNHPTSEFRKATEEVMNGYSHDDRVKYIQHSSNLNASTARNSGFNKSTGEFICFLDDDDWFFPEKVERQVTFLNDHPQYGGVYCGAVVKNKSSISMLEGDLTEDLLQMKTALFTPAIMFRRQAVKGLKGFDPRFTRHQDYEFMMRFFRNNRIGVVPAPLVHIGMNAGENKPSAKALERCKYLFFTVFHEEMEARGSMFRRKVYAIHYMQVFAAYLRERNFADALRIFGSYFFHSPFYFTAALFKRAALYLRYRKLKRSTDAC